MRCRRDAAEANAVLHTGHLVTGWIPGDHQIMKRRRGIAIKNKQQIIGATIRDCHVIDFELASTARINLGNMRSAVSTKPHVEDGAGAAKWADASIAPATSRLPSAVGYLADSCRPQRVLGRLIRSRIGDGHRAQHEATAAWKENDIVGRRY